MTNSYEPDQSDDVEEGQQLLDTSLIERRKVPVVLQSEAMECGLACLTMVMASFGRDQDLMVLRAKYPASQRGVSMARMGQIAQDEGFLMTAYTAEAHEMTELKLPAILHWRGNHFVVLTKYVAGKSATVHDPAVGVRKLSWAQFVDGFSGSCCEFEPLASMQKVVVREKLSALTLLEKTHGWLPAVLKMGVIALLFEALLLVSPLFLQTVVDEVIPVGDNRLLWSLAAGFAGIVVVKSLASLSKGWLAMALAGMMALSMKVMTFNHMLKLPLSWFEKRGVGTVSARYDSLGRIREILSENVLLTVVDSLVALVMVGVLLAYEWKLALLTLGAAMVSFVVTILMYRRYALAANEMVLADAEEARVLIESISAVPAAKMFGQERRQLALYRKRVVESTNRMLDMLRVKTWHASAQLLLNGLSDVLMVAVAAHFVLEGELSLGVMFGFYAYKTILSEKLTSLGDAYFQFRLLSVFTQNAGDVLLSETEKAAQHKLTVSAQPKLTFEDVSFTYEEADAPTLDKFCLTVQPGEVVAVTGPSGGGKSTLIKLLTGALQPSSGRILLDNENIVGLAPSDVREHLGVVLQSDHLFTGTLLENITMFEEHPDMEHVRRAVEDAALAEVIDAIPTGLQTYILGHAPTLSGGQKQRLLLARAFYKNASVLVLDEATSALDVEREIHVCEAIRRKGKTTLMVAHRQETLARCDRVVRIG